MSDNDGEVDLSLDAVFPEPPRPPTPEPKISIYFREVSSNTHESQGKTNSQEIKIRLVGSHPLWGHYLWNSARCLSSFLDENPKMSKDRLILELGAGGGLPSIISTLNGARKVVLTDYPDADLVENMRLNVNENAKEEGVRERVSVKGYIWGTPVEPLLDDLSETATRGFHVIILSDLIFNHSQHGALLKTCELALLPPKPTSSEDGSDSEILTPCVLVFYTHHRPHLAHRDMEFFEKARGRGWTCEEIVTRKYPLMFPEDPGAEEVRSTVHGWKLTRPARLDSGSSTLRELGENQMYI